ncbi:MAG: hypothetical protein JNM47_10520 [Hyphomonadaceae bacterium]|nr:hypothetical protein [Hyphomonadaceae bacterium]
MTENLAASSTEALLRLHANILHELRERRIVRSTNNPVGDYAEVLFAKAFGWMIESNSARGHDAIDGSGLRYQIKARRLTHHNPSRQLGVLRELDQSPFDHLAAVLFDEQFAVFRAIILPRATVLAQSAYKQRVNGWRFVLNDSSWTAPGAIDATEHLRETARAL